MQRLMCRIEVALLSFCMLILSGCGASGATDSSPPPPPGEGVETPAATLTVTSEPAPTTDTPTASPAGSNAQPTPSTGTPITSPAGGNAQPSGTIAVRDPTIHPPGMQPIGRVEESPFGDDASGLFLTLINQGNTATTLTNVQTDAAETVAFYRVQPPQQFSPIEAIELPAGEQVTLEPGPGYHIVLQNFTREVQVGDTIELTLTFAQAGQITTQAEVRMPTPGQSRGRTP